MPELTPRTVEDRLAELEKRVAGLAQPPVVPLPAMQPTYPCWGGRWEWIPDYQPVWCGTGVAPTATTVISSAQITPPV